jgi:cytochrome P450
MITKDPVKVKGNFLLGSALEMKKSPVDFFKRLEEMNFPLVHFRLAHMSCCYLTQPSAAHYVMQENHKNYLKGGIFFDIARGIMGNGLVFSDDEFWLSQRRILNPVFHKKAIDTFYGLMLEHTLTLIDKWKSKNNNPVDVHADMNTLTCSIATKTLFGTSLDEEKSSQLIKCMEIMLSENQRRTNTGISLPFWIPTPANQMLKQTINQYNQIVIDVIKRRTENPKDEACMLDLLLAATDNETGRAMTMQQVIDEVKVFFLAGTETSANVLTWAIHLLAEHPEVREKLKKEVDDLFAGKLPELEELSQLSYGMQVLNEVMRYYPPSWLISRTNRDEDIIEGVKVKKNTSIFISPYLLHRHPGYWDKPDVFNPERFAQPLSPDQQQAFVPFGAGPRKCIGHRFAMMELQLVLILLIQNFTWELKPGFYPETEFETTLRPKEGMWMTMRANG